MVRSLVPPLRNTLKPLINLSSLWYPESADALDAFARSSQADLVILLCGGDKRTPEPGHQEGNGDRGEIGGPG